MSVQTLDMLSVSCKDDSNSTTRSINTATKRLLSPNTSAVTDHVHVSLLRANSPVVRRLLAMQPLVSLKQPTTTGQSDTTHNHWSVRNNQQPLVSQKQPTTTGQSETTNNHWSVRNNQLLLVSQKQPITTGQSETTNYHWPVRNNPQPLVSQKQPITTGQSVLLDIIN